MDSMYDILFTFIIKMCNLPILLVDQWIDLLRMTVYLWPNSSLDQIEKRLSCVVFQKRDATPR